jgi:hypothetical protein
MILHVQLRAVDRAVPTEKVSCVSKRAHRKPPQNGADGIEDLVSSYGRHCKVIGVS